MAGFILGIAGSPRKNGNSDRMLQASLEAAEEAGASTRAVYLRDLSFSSCIGCEACRKAKACITLEDDMQELYPLVQEAEGLILASPAHNYNVTAIMKAFIDRLYAFYDFTEDHPRAYSSRLADKERFAAALSVAEQMDAYDMGFTTEGLERPLKPFGYEIVGNVEAYGVFHKSKVLEQQNIMDECATLGKNLAGRIAL
jgi:multimeric flavodoxin WrbA